MKTIYLVVLDDYDNWEEPKILAAFSDRETAELLAASEEIHWKDTSRTLEIHEVPLDKKHFTDRELFHWHRF